LRDIERAIDKRLPRVILPGFDYQMKPREKLEIPLGQRLEAVRSARGHGHKPPRPHGRHGRRGASRWRGSSR
jgi:hypothetical protein